MKEHHVLFFACLVSLCGLLTARSVISALGDVKLLTPSVGPSVGTPARTSRSLVLPAHLFGLANRLRTMSCVNILAGDSGRGLSVHWLPSPECNVEFTDLFNTTAMARHGVLSTYTLREGEMLHHVKRNADPSSHVFDLHSNMPCVQVTANTLNPAPLWAKLKSDAPDVCLESTGVFRPLHISCQEYLIRRSHFYQSLIPVDPIAAAVEAFYEKHMRGRLCIGAHIRVDGAHDYPVVPGGAGGDEPWAHVSPPALIEKAISEVLLHQRGATVFIASNYDSPDAVTLRSLGCDPSLPLSTLVGLRDTSCGMRIAFVEWLLLSRTSLIIHPFWSSFAEEASIVHMTPRVMMKDGDAIVGFDVNKPDCGYFYDDPAALAKYYSSSSTEPGHDQPAKKFVKTFSPCDAFTQAWGLERAYC